VFVSPTNLIENRSIPVGIAAQVNWGKGKRRLLMGARIPKGDGCRTCWSSAPPFYL
jgi:hypothetical protein